MPNDNYMTYPLVNHLNSRNQEIAMRNIGNGVPNDTEAGHNKEPMWKYNVKYFPRLFITVIYIVILFVSFGTILTQLIIFSKGKNYA